MRRRPTISDIAAAAGVSISTVDRVLNGREKVREGTARRVYDAAHGIGYHATNAIRQRLQAELPLMRFGFVLQKESQPFYRNFADELTEAVRQDASIRGQVEIVFAQSQDPREHGDLMRDLGARVHALGAVAVNHHLITAAVSDLKAKGVPCVAILNDFAQGVRQHYVGLNNLKVGRMAAWAIANASGERGDVALFVGGPRWHGHELRETGFRSFFREYSPNSKVLDTLVNLETRAVTYEATLNLLHRNRDLKGFYLAGGGMEGAIEALRECRAPGEVALVVNELTDASGAGLQEHYVSLIMATPLARMCRQLIHLMRDASHIETRAAPGQLFMQPDLYIPESL